MFVWALAPIKMRPAIADKPLYSQKITTFSSPLRCRRSPCRDGPGQSPRRRRWKEQSAFCPARCAYRKTFATPANRKNTNANYYFRVSFFSGSPVTSAISASDIPFQFHETCHTDIASGQFSDRKIFGSLVIVRIWNLLSVINIDRLFVCLFVT